LQSKLPFYSKFHTKRYMESLVLLNNKFGIQRITDLYLKKLEQADILFFVLLKNKSLKLGFLNHLLIDELHFTIFHVVYHYFKQIIEEKRLFRLLSKH
jgi:hypothetical protein